MELFNYQPNSVVPKRITHGGRRKPPSRSVSCLTFSAVRRCLLRDAYVHCAFDIDCSSSPGEAIAHQTDVSFRWRSVAGRNDITLRVRLTSATKQLEEQRAKSLDVDCTRESGSICERRHRYEASLIC